MKYIKNPWFFEKEAGKCGYKVIAGIDEAGRGPLAGPVVACAVVLPENFDPQDIYDSKKISQKKREQLFDRIMCDASGIGIGIVESDIIDEINILKATHLAMKRAVLDIGFDIDFALVDGCPVYGLPVKSKSIIKGDSKSVSISAASIIAKVTRDRLMTEADEKYPGYGFAQHKGYGTKKHMEALEKLGPCKLHRVSFAPVYVRSMQCRLTGLE